MLRATLSVLAGILAVPLCEIFAVIWMTTAPADIDLTGSYFLSIVIPSVVLVHLLLTLLFWKALAGNPLRNCTLFIGTHALFQGAAVTYLANPPADVAAYVGIILASGLLISIVFRRYFWNTESAIS